MGTHRPGRRPGRRREFRGTGVHWSLVAGLVLAVAILIGIVQNSQQVELRYLVWSGHVPLLVILLATVVLVVALDEALGLVWRWRRRRHLTERELLLEVRAQPVPQPRPEPSEGSAGTSVSP
jgi:uncharacterized integral membrane protein